MNNGDGRGYVAIGNFFIHTISVEVIMMEANNDETTADGHDFVELSRRAKTLPKLVVPTDFRKAHILVRTTLKKMYRKNSYSSDPIPRIFPCDLETLDLMVSRACSRRALLFLDCLIRGVEELGGTVAIEKYHWRIATCVQFAGEVATAVSVRERYKQRERGPDAKNKDFHWQKYEYLTTGQLLVEAGPSSGRPYCEDKGSIKIEDRINELLIRFVDMAEIARRRRVNEEAASVRRIQREKDRAEKLRLIAEEEGRISNLLLEAKNWEQSCLIRRYLAAVQEAAMTLHGEIEEGSEFHTWMTWATRQADRLDPLVESPPSILDEKQQLERAPQW